MKYLFDLDNVEFMALLKELQCTHSTYVFSERLRNLI